eukprot:scaffold146427_cov33-Tisochrysis_lutea.AAC.4
MKCKGRLTWVRISTSERSSRIASNNMVLGSNAGSGSSTRTPSTPGASRRRIASSGLRRGVENAWGQCARGLMLVPCTDFTRKNSLWPSIPNHMRDIRVVHRLWGGAKLIVLRFRGSSDDTCTHFVLSLLATAVEDISKFLQLLLEWAARWSSQEPRWYECPGAL